MANNPYVNKVQYGNTVVMDLTADTVTAGDVKSGVTFHDATGEAKSGSLVISNKTPSNSSPASLSSGANYHMNNAGYAIESYNIVNPNNTIPDTLTDGAISKINGNGVAVASIDSVTPSNSSPASIGTDKIYKSTGRGQLIQGTTLLNPSDSSPAAIYSTNVYKPNNNGYAIESNPTSLTPSDSNPPSVASGDMVKVGGAGYLVENPPKMAHGSFTPTGNTDNENFCNCGFRPKFIAVLTLGSASTGPTNVGRGASSNIYNEDVSTSYCYEGFLNSQNTAGYSYYEVAHNGTTSKISEITDTGFYWRHANNNYYRGLHYWFAMG